MNILRENIFLILSMISAFLCLYFGFILESSISHIFVVLQLLFFVLFIREKNKRVNE